MAAPDPFQAFDRRLDRRLAEMQTTASEALADIERRMVRTELRDRAHLEELRLQVTRAADFALSEAERLPGRANIRRSETAPVLKAKLDEYARALFRLKWFFEMPTALVNAEDARVRQLIAGEIEDYEAGVWRPRGMERREGLAFGSLGSPISISPMQGEAHGDAAAAADLGSISVTPPEAVAHAEGTAGGATLRLDGISFGSDPPAEPSGGFRLSGISFGTDALGFPEIPAAEPAAIDPKWVGGRLAIDRTSAPSEAPDDLADIFAALHIVVERLAEDLKPVGNESPRLYEMIRSTVELLPAAGPDRVGVYLLGHRYEELQEAAGEAATWSDPFPARYRALLTNLRRALALFPQWAEFADAREARELTDEQVRAAYTFALVAGDELSKPGADEVVGEGVPEAVREIAAPLRPASLPEPGSSGFGLAIKRRALDVVRSLGNIYKALAGGLREGVLEQIRTTTKDYGKELVKWGDAIFRVGLFEATSALSHSLSVMFPHSFLWLGPFIAWVAVTKARKGD